MKPNRRTVSLYSISLLIFILYSTSLQIIIPKHISFLFIYSSLLLTSGLIVLFGILPVLRNRARSYFTITTFFSAWCSMYFTTKCYDLILEHHLINFFFGTDLTDSLSISMAISTAALSTAFCVFVVGWIIALLLPEACPNPCEEQYM